MLNNQMMKWWEYLPFKKTLRPRITSELLLAECEQRFQYLADNTPMMVRVLDSSGGCTFFNLSWRRFMGDGANVRNWQNLVHPEDSARLTEQINSAFQSHEQFSIEYRIRHQSGESRWVMEQAIPRFTADGTFVGFASTALDITDRRESEMDRAESLQRERRLHSKTEEALRARNILLSALRASEEQYRFLSEAVPHIVWTATSDGSIDYFNSRWTESTGMKMSEALSWGWVKALHPADSVECLRRWRASVKKGEIFEMEFRLQSSKGDFHWQLSRAIPFRDSRGKITRWVGTCTDIDLRKKALQDLQDKQNQLDLALRAAQMGPWELDFETGRASWTSASEAVLGVQQFSHSDDYDAIIKLVHPDDVALAKVENILKSAESDNTRYEFRAVLANGELRWIENHCHIVRDDSGKPLRIVGVSTDITERKRFEHELQRARDAAEEANRAKSSFLANMSHEIRTPLGAVLGFAEVLAGEDLKVNERQDAIQAIRRNGELLAHLINDILDLSKVEAGHMEIEKVDVSLPELVNGVLHSHIHLAKEKGIELKWDSNTEVPERVSTDPTRLRQILMNLVGNGVKFTGRGHVHMILSVSGDQLDFRIEDTGCGITSEQASRLFEPFMQADSSTTRRFGGTGLGLALSRRLAGSLGGSLSLAESRVGQGSTFVLRIPFEYDPKVKMVRLGYTEAPQGDDVLAPAPKAKQLDGVKILLVEDSPDNRMLLSRFLQLAGSHVSFAENGREGADAAMAGQYDLILMDIQMPVLDGCQATAELRARGYHGPIIAITAHAMKGERERILGFGFNDYMSKPINTRLLINMVSHYARDGRGLGAISQSAPEVSPVSRMM